MKKLLLAALLLGGWFYREPIWTAMRQFAFGQSEKHELANQASVLRKIQDLNRLESTEFHIDTIIKTEKEGNWYALWQDSQKGIFTARGSVTAGLDLNRLTADNIKILDDNHAIINLPPVEILSVRLDKINVYDIRTGTLNLRQPDMNVLTDVQLYAKQQILRQACADNIMQDAAEGSRVQIELLFALTPLKVSAYLPAATPECRLHASGK